MVSRMAAPAVMGATLPGRERAQMTVRPNSPAAPRSTPPGLEARSRIRHSSFTSSAQHPGGDGVDDEVIAAKPPRQLAQRLRPKAHGLGPGELVIFPGGHSDPGPQGMEAVGGELAHPSEAQHQGPAAVDGDGQVLHGQLDGPLRRGHGVGHRQFLPGKVVPDGQVPLLCQGVDLFAHPAAQNHLARRQPVQNIPQRVIGGGEGGVEQPLPLGHREGENDTVGQVDGQGSGLGDGALQVPGQVQGVGADGVAVLAEQAGQPGLALVAAYHPDIQFLVHGNVHLRRRRAGGGFLRYPMPRGGWR